MYKWQMPDLYCQQCRCCSHLVLYAPYTSVCLISQACFTCIGCWCGSYHMTDTCTIMHNTTVLGIHTQTYGLWVYWLPFNSIKSLLKLLAGLMCLHVPPFYSICDLPCQCSMPGQICKEDPITTFCPLSPVSPCSNLTFKAYHLWAEHL